MLQQWPDTFENVPMEHTDNNTMARDADDVLDLEALAQAEHLRFLLKLSPIIFLANLSAGATLMAGLWSAVSTGALITWFVALVLLNGFRWIKGRQFAAEPWDRKHVEPIERLFLLGTALSGCVWGIAGLVFYVPDQPAHSTFLALVLIAMAAAATAALSIHRFAYPLFFVPAVVPLTACLIVDGETAQVALGLAIPLYFTLLFVLSRQIYAFSHQSIISGLQRERHALADHLTGIANRRAFEEFLKEEWHRGLRTRRSLALVLADVDDFKHYNDTYGHSVGDDVLKSVASLFQQSAHRGTDLAARIGGEEFAIILPETDLEGGLAFARNLRETCEAYARDTANRWEFPTLSLGVCSTIPDAASDEFSLFKHADAALYRAKADGKNCVKSCAAGYFGERALLPSSE